jgi:hypothetical protein
VAAWSAGREGGPDLLGRDETMLKLENVMTLLWRTYFEMVADANISK